MNYYGILGLSENSSQEEIKNAFRKLSKEFHPDTNKNPDSEKKYKEISEAYTALKDPSSRQQYDQKLKMENFQRNANRGPSSFGGNFNNDYFNIDDIIRDMGFPGFNMNQSRQRNMDININYSLSLEEAFTGVDTTVKFNTPDGQYHEIKVNIPKGIDSGNRLRVEGKGYAKIHNLPPGDIFINIHLIKHPVFVRHGHNLVVSVILDYIDAIVGKEVKIKTIDMSELIIKIPPNFEFGKVMRVPGKGMSILNNSDARGDMLVEVMLKPPTWLSSEQLEIIKNIADVKKASCI